MGTHNGPVNPQTIMVAGDSVPNYLSDYFGRLGHERRRDVFSAAQGMCTPMGLPLDFDNGVTTPKACPQVLERQSEIQRRRGPGVVVWWSRHE